MSRSHPISIVLAATLAVLAASAAAADGGASPSITSPHLVRLEGPPLARRPGGLAGSLAALEAERLAAEQERALAAIGARLGRSAVPLRHYGVATNGFALDLTPAEAAAVAALPGVAAVQPSRNLRPASDAGPAWIGAPGIWNGTATGGLPGTQGEGVVIGVIDTGINMTHPSFADVGGDGFDHVNPRGAGNHVGFCDPGNPAFDPSLPCNDKLIGVWSFPNAGDDPRDDHGHGSHIAAIAAGNRLPAATQFPGASLVVPLSGVAPHANLIAYDACFHVSGDFTSCSQADVLAAIDQAVVDGVDVLNLSLVDEVSFFGSPWDDPVALALLAAREAEIVVVSAVDDFGSGLPDGAPWVITASAATHDRRFGNALIDLVGGGSTPPASLVGDIPGPGYGPASIVEAADFGDDFCLDPFPAGTFAGEIVVCQRVFFSSLAFAAANVQAGGGGGVVIVDGFNDGPTAETFSLPTVLLSSAGGSTLRSWLASGSGHTGRIAGATRQLDPADGDHLFFLAGGPGPVADVVKPDLTAPGVDVLAAWKDPGSFALRSGTSIASAVVAGAAALLVDLHPDWSPAEVQSALVTTGVGTTLDDDFSSPRPATPHEEGGGRIDLVAAARAGLLLDESPAAFGAADPDAGGQPGALNLPGLAEDSCLDRCSWMRTVESAAAVPTHWTASATVPPGMSVTVTPSSFTLPPGAVEDLEIELSGFPSASFGSSWAYGAVTLTESGGLAPPVRLPLAALAIARFDLSVTVTGGGSGQVTSSPAGIACPSDCAEGFPEDSTVTLTATANPGSTFAGWDGDCFVGSPTCSLSMFFDRQATAFFVPELPDLPLANRVPLRDGFQGPVENGLTKHYFVDVPPGTAALVVDLFDLTREALLLVRFGQKATPSQAQCADLASQSFSGPGIEPARCFIAAPQAGRWWIGVNNEQTQRFDYSVRASWGTGSGSETPLPNGGAIGDFVTSLQSGGTFKFYSLDVEPGSASLLVELTELSADADLYLRFGAKPSATTFDCASTAGSTLPESCQVVTPQAGRWWVGVRNFSAGTVVYRLSARWGLPAPTSFFTITPCRVFDSRQSAVLFGNVRRTIPVAGTCGIPASARAVAANVTVVLPSGPGHVTLFPGTAAAAPLASTINFSPGQVRANNAILPLGTNGTIAALPVMPGGQVDLILDVVGYFE